MYVSLREPWVHWAKVKVWDEGKEKKKKVWDEGTQRPSLLCTCVLCGTSEQKGAASPNARLLCAHPTLSLWSMALVGGGEPHLAAG